MTDASTTAAIEPAPRPASWVEAWERREQKLIAVLPFVMLAISAGLMLAVDPDGATLVLAGATAVWLLAWRAGPVQRASARAAWPGAVHFAVLVVLMAALVAETPWFGFFAWTGYFKIVELRGRWRVAGVVATAIIVGASQAGGPPPNGSGSWLGVGVLAAINVAVAGALLWMNFVGDERTLRHRRLIGELEASLEENAELHAQLLAQARQAGVVEERTRMAREIHDTLAQGLTGIVAQLQASDGDEWERRRDAALDLARQSLSEARRSVQALRPEPLEGVRLPDALADVAGSWTSLSGIPAEVTTTGAAHPLRPEIEVTLLRTAQEGLANVAKHAHARRVGLTLSYMEDVVRLDVRDDGVGFDPARRRDGGFGLLGMRERLLAHAGTLEIESEPGGGTALSASMPAIPA